jgi:hypothetical protein
MLPVGQRRGLSIEIGQSKFNRPLSSIRSSAVFFCRELTMRIGQLSSLLHSAVCRKFILLEGGAPVDVVRSELFSLDFLGWATHERSHNQTLCPLLQVNEIKRFRCS